MDDRDNRLVLARRVRHAVAELEGICVLPQVAAHVFSKLGQSTFSVHDIADTLRVSPALAVVVFSKAREAGLSPVEYGYDVVRLATKLPPAPLSQALLSLQPYRGLQAEQAGPNGVIVGRADIVTHSLVVALAASRVARLLDGSITESLAYVAGLLHDIGKLALQQALPKGYARLVGRARTQRASLLFCEREQLGTDHAAIGAYLAKRWHLPTPIQRAIWLHPSPLTVSEGLPEDLVVARIVHVADALARRAGLGVSGSYETMAELDVLASSLGLSAEQLATVQSDLPALLEQSSPALQLTLEDPEGHMLTRLHDLAVAFHAHQVDLADECRGLKADRAHLDFIQALLESLDSAMDVLDVAEFCARQWQRYYQTGKVCLLIYPEREGTPREVVLIDELAHGTQLVLEKNLDDMVECAAEGLGVELVEAYDWEPLFEEIEAGFAIDRTRAVILRSGGRALGALAFELNTPGEQAAIQRTVKDAAHVIGRLLEVSRAQEEPREVLEELISLMREPAPRSAGVNVLEAVTEMAAGLAHELNNPLSVIAGRAQLLAESVTDEQAIPALKLIQENARDVAHLVESLIGFADPPTPDMDESVVRRIMTDAIEMTCQKLDLEELNIQITCPDPSPIVWVDSAMITSALGNVLANAVESYDGPGGVIELAVGIDDAGDQIILRVRDEGRGMDETTLRKATQPFFSSKPAGRKRGMGLAYAQRLLHVNRGSLEISSQVMKGTTVSLFLPMSQSGPSSS
ncbi:HDOD domain-containing protein [Planctomycetota bacterium]